MANLVSFVSAPGHGLFRPEMWRGFEDRYDAALSYRGRPWLHCFFVHPKSNGIMFSRGRGYERITDANRQELCALSRGALPWGFCARRREIVARIACVDALSVPLSAALRPHRDMEVRLTCERYLSHFW